MSTDVTRRIQDLSQRYVSELTEIARDALVARLRDLTLPQSPKSASVSSHKRTGRGRGEKRPAAELEALQQQALSAIKSHPDGVRVEELNRALKLEPGVLALPLKKLVAAKAIKTTGVRRATRYFVGRKGTKGPKARRAKRRKQK